MIAGTIYGVVLNDVSERTDLASVLCEAPYAKPPEAPVVYIKPRSCVRTGGAPVRLPDGASKLSAGATLALLVGRDACRLRPLEAIEAISAAALALDLTLPAPSYYRPVVMERSCDGFLPIGDFGALVVPDTITTIIDNAAAHEWQLDRLVRPVQQLIADLSQFMTLRRGDLLMVGLPGDAPDVTLGQTIEVRAQGLASLKTRIEGGRP